MRLPLELLWTGGLGLGYVSMNLKTQLRRRGHADSDRRKSYADLISLQKVSDPAPPPSAGTDRSSGSASR